MYCTACAEAGDLKTFARLLTGLDVRSNVGFCKSEHSRHIRTGA
jgi:hypothetical protein